MYCKVQKKTIITKANVMKKLQILAYSHAGFARVYASECRLRKHCVRTCSYGNIYLQVASTLIIKSLYKNKTISKVCLITGIWGKDNR